MGKTREAVDASNAKKEKKSKKNKTKTNDMLDVGDGEGDGNSHIEVGGHLPKEEGDKHREKERKSESSEDGYEDQHDEGDLVNDGDLQKTDKKKKKKRKRHSSEHNQGEDDEPAGEIACDPKRGKKKTSYGKETDTSVEVLQEDMFEKIDKKKKRENDSSEKNQVKDNEQGQHDEPIVEADCEPKTGEKKTRDGKGTEISMEGCEEDKFEKTDKKKKKKKNKTDTEMNGTITEASTLKTQDNEDIKGSKGKKKTKSVKSSEKQKGKVKGGKVNKKATESVENNNTEKPKAKAKGKSKKVSFAGQVEVFPSSDTEPDKQATKGDGLVRGKRFTPEEDAIVKQAVLDYVTAHDLGEDGLKMVLHCNSHAGMKKCWQEIGTRIPYRPYTAVYSRAHILFERSEHRSWTPEEIELLKEGHKKHGNDWKKLADELGKHRFHVKDTWRRIKFENLKLGKWSQEEYQSLYDLVNMDLQMKIYNEKKSKHGMLRDNIPWTAISEKLSTRSDSTCCVKWYNQLTSSLVAEKKWSDADDYRMIGALYELDAACVEDVDWDNLLEHRPGDICRKRWEQMVKHIDHGSKPFAEQVDTLAKRYCPDLAETREAWDNKPVVP